jgi:glycolate oxidase FAD binding subunit
MADVLSLINSRNQEFAFEPMNTARLLGTPDVGTIAGMIAAGFAGPRRIKAGAARDHLLGANAVSGFGDSFKAGGKVVKNVTGYDLCKLLAGSWGTLAVMTEVTLKVMPRAESECTLVLRGLDDLTANRAMTASLGSPYDVSGAAHVPAPSQRGEDDALADLAQGQAVTLIRLEGIDASVRHRAGSVSALLNAFAAAELVSDSASASLWSSVRDAVPLAHDGPFGAWPVWRIICPPASGGALGQALQRDLGAVLFYDWGGGLIWAAVPPADDAHAAALRAQVSAVDGHASLIRAGEGVRRVVDVFQPQARGLAALGERVRHSFDPKSILNRGRMTRGIIR